MEENKDSQPEQNPSDKLREDFPKFESKIVGQMKTHPSNPLYRFPTDENLKAVMDTLNEASKAHFPGGKVSRDAEHKCPEGDNCELCWSVATANGSKQLDKYIQVAAVEMLGPTIVLMPYARVWAFAFFMLMLGMRAERRDRDHSELAQLEKLMSSESN